MNDTSSPRGDYQIEISGWGLDEGFFVERTELRWDTNGEKQVHLHHAMGEGSIVFVRLLTFEPSNTSVPVAYQVKEVLPTDRRGRCTVSLSQLHPRGRAAQVSFPAQAASNDVEDSQAACNAVESVDELQHEEILQ